MRLILTLRLRLLMLWLFTLAVCIALGFMIRDVYQLGTEAQTEKTVGYAQQACVALQTEYARSVKPGTNASDTVLMGALLNVILGEVPGVESATVNFAAGSATVRYDETRLEVADIKASQAKRVPALHSCGVTARCGRRTRTASPRQGDARPAVFQPDR